MSEAQAMEAGNGAANELKRARRRALLQIQGGKLDLRASGYLVRENDTIRRNSLDDEMQRLAEHLRSVLGVKG